MAAPSFQFEPTRELFQMVLQDKSGDQITQLTKTFNNTPGSESEKKSAVDQALRDIIQKLVVKDVPCEMWTEVIQLAVSVVPDLCYATTPFILLSDMFDCKTLDQCEEVFKFVESHVSTWKSDTFYTAGKNYLLRMCNDLLRRLSKSQNTVFCGRIQLFLARLFPLDERSGLNLMSHFNLDNVTLYITEPEEYLRSRQHSIDEKEKMDGMDFEEGETDDSVSTPPIDYTLYRKFWSLQDYFRAPTQCYQKVPWKTFTNHAAAVLQTFESYKLDDIKSQKTKLEQLRKSDSHAYFAKYLTSEKLLDLQLSDSNFRRYVLVQFLILFQYLNSSIKFKSSSQVLSEDQASWVKDMTDRVYKSLRETPPDGAKFGKAIEHILSREENWSAWKNEGCPSFIHSKTGDADAKLKNVRTKKRSLGDDLKASGGKLIKMGNSELTRLWNLCPDNMEACSQTERMFVPSLEGFFEDAVMQADPAMMVEDQYKLINNQSWGWKALRLLARRSTHFHCQAQQPSRSLPEYLDDMISKVAKELPQAHHSPSEDAKHDSENGEETTEIKEEGSQAEDLQNEDQGKEEHVDMVTKDQIEELGQRLAGDWKKLAMELNFPEDEIAYFESETENKSSQATKMLTIWQENEAEKATGTALHQSLKEIGLGAVADTVLGNKRDT